MADLFEDYPAGAAWDEMIDADGGSRAAYKGLHTALAELSAGELRARAETLARSYLAQGVTFDFAGEERPFPLDVVPRGRLRPAEGDRRRRDPALGRRLLDELPAGGPGHHAAERCAGARLRHRPDPRQPRRLARPRGQRAGAERRQLRAVQPAR